MPLKYGLDKYNNLTHISEVTQWRAPLTCLYCAGLLLPSTDISEFVHEEETCAPSQRDTWLWELPFYQHFDEHFSENHYHLLSAFTEQGIAIGNTNLAFLKRGGYIRPNRKRDSLLGNYCLTRKGQVILGRLPLREFSEFQTQRIQDKHTKLENAAREAKASADFPVKFVDLLVYRAEIRRVLRMTAFLLYVPSLDAHQYVAVVGMDLEGYIAKLKRKIRVSTIELWGKWPHRGSIVPYFDHYYSHTFDPAIVEKTQLGDEVFFRFNKGSFSIVWNNLSWLGLKNLNGFEDDVFCGRPPLLQRELVTEATERRRRQAIREGMKAAVEQGKSIGRPHGVETIDAFLTKPKTLAIKRALEQGLSLREAARQAGASVNTVRKVQAYLTQPTSKRQDETP